MTADFATLQNTLAAELGADAVHANEPMSAHTTFRCGGPAALFAEPCTIDQVRVCVGAARECGVEYRVVGCGSNLLVADAGLGMLIIHLGERFARIQVDGCRITAQAGATNREVANAAHDAGLTGYEFASGIPGSIGGAAYMNAGAYDGEFKDVCVGVSCLDAQGELVELTAAEAQFSYRNSAMQQHGYVVLSATIELRHANKADIKAVMDDLQARRESKQPLELGSAGSTFKRPAGYFAGKLVQDAGMQGHRAGGAMVSTKHAGFVVNAGGATAADVCQVIRDVQKAVYEMEGVVLEPEVRMWGF